MASRSVWNRISGSTIAIVVAFVITLLLIGAGVAVGLRFFDIKAAGGIDPSTSHWTILVDAVTSVFSSWDGKATAVDTSRWSSISDAVNAVLGIPTSLAGAVVAVALAHRAYVLAKRQVRYDSLGYVESLIGNTEQVYWTLSNSLRSLERAAADLYALILNNTVAVGKTGGYQDSWEKVEEHQVVDLEAAHLKLRSASDDVASAILSIMRDPLARVVWSSWDKEREDHGAIPYFNRLSLNAGDNPVMGLVASMGKDFLDRHPAELSQVVAGGSSDFGEKELGELPKIMAFDKEKRSRSGEAAIISHPDGVLREGRLRASTDELDVLIRVNRRDYAKSLRSRWIYSRERSRLEVIGALVCLRPLLSTAHEGNGAPFHNLGAAILCEVVQRQPTVDRLNRAIERLLIERGEDDPNLIKVALRMIQDKGFHLYVSPWMRKAAVDLEKHPEELIYRRPETGSYSGSIDLRMKD